MLSEFRPLGSLRQKTQSSSSKHADRAACTTCLSEVFEDVIDDDLLGLVGVHSGERVHVDDSIFKPNQRKAQGAF